MGCVHRSWKFPFQDLSSNSNVRFFFFSKEEDQVLAFEGRLETRRRFLAVWDEGHALRRQTVADLRKNTISTTAYFQRLRTPAHANTNFFVWLKTRASMRLKKNQLWSQRFASIACVGRHNHALHVHLERRHHSRLRRHAGLVSDGNNPSSALQLKKHVWLFC